MPISRAESRGSKPFTDKVVILADRREGKPLNDKEGLLRSVAVGEKRQSRWVRQVMALTILAVR